VVALVHVLELSVTNACITFLELCGVDSLQIKVFSYTHYLFTLQVDVEAVWRIIDYQKSKPQKDSKKYNTRYYLGLSYAQMIVMTIPPSRISSKNSWLSKQNKVSFQFPSVLGTKATAESEDKSLLTILSLLEEATKSKTATNIQ
jgi:hypothetical protein